jgi:hypothetical protein
LNGDGYADFVTNTAMSPFTMRVYFGGNPPDTIPTYTWTNFYLGWTPLVADVNGDGYGDLMVPRTLRTDVHFGAQTLSSTPNCALTFPGCGNGPMVIDYAGDFNGDGYGDLAAVSDCDMGFGALRLYLGHPWLNSDPVVSIDGGDLPLDLIGICDAAGVGDVNGDGIQDLAIGATNEMTYHEGRRGRVVILSGDTTLRVGVDNPGPELPQELRMTIYPNPFNITTHLEFTLPSTQRVSLRLYDVLGREVAVLMNEIRTAGQHQMMFDASGLPSGLYLCRLEAGEMAQTRKMVLLK